MIESAGRDVKYGTVMFAALVGVWLTSGCTRAAPRESAAPEGGGSGLRVGQGLLVAHALGKIDGVSYTNSLEALRCNHRRGFRWFEVDLTLTQDAQLVAFHTEHEKHAGFDRPIAEVPLSDVRAARYRDKFPIVTFADVLAEASRLGDAVLVTDTKTWSAQMVEAVERVVMAAPRPRAGIALQAYRDKHLGEVADLAKRLDAEVIFTLYKTRASDEAVVDLAKRHGVLAIVASQQRFSPWLAEGLHAAQVPILVHTVNAHEEIVKFTRAGADGFYTDSYIPYERMAADRQVVLDCGAVQASPKHLSFWLRRDIENATDHRLSSCARRSEGRVEIGGCDAKPAISAAPLPVPPRSEVSIELEVQAPTATEVNFWFELVPKDGAKRSARETLHLAAGERRTFAWDLPLQKGSPGLETRLGMSSSEGRLTVLRFVSSVRPELPPDEQSPTAPRG